MRNLFPSNERGATLVHVSFMLAGLIAFSAFVTDYGILWVSRRQAQNAADAAALAGALGLAHNDYTDRSPTGPATVGAVNAGNLNSVWGTAASITAADITFPPCPTDGSNACVRAEVFRDASHSNALPSFFGKMVGLSSQNVRATATAEVFQSDVASCLKPWALIDRWQNNWENGTNTTPPVDPRDPSTWEPDPRWTTSSLYDKYKQNGDLDPSVGKADDYDRLRDGFRLYDPADTTKFSVDYGMPLTLKIGQANMFNAGWFQALDLICPGANCYETAIEQCTEVNFAPLNPDGTCPPDTRCEVEFETGNMVGPTSHGVGDLCARDPNATWNDLTKVVEGSNGLRLVQVPIMSPEDVSTTKNGKTSAYIRAIIGFYIMCPGDAGYTAGPGDVQGRLVDVTGNLTSNSTAPGSNPNTFLLTVGLIR